MRMLEGTEFEIYLGNITTAGYNGKYYFFCVPWHQVGFDL